MAALDLTALRCPRGWRPLLLVVATLTLIRPVPAAAQPDSFGLTAEPTLAVEGDAREAEPPTCATVRLYYLRDTSALLRALEPLCEALAPEVTLADTGALGGMPTVVLAGPRAQVDDVRRLLADLDQPHPQIRLELWSFQISGEQAEQVAYRAQQARDAVETMASLMRSWLRQLEAAALAAQERNRRLAEAAEASSADPALPASLEGMLSQLMQSGPKLDLAQLGEWGEQPGAVVVTSSARGRHPLSINETLATLLLTPTPARQWRDSLEADLRPQMAAWLEHLRRQDPEALETWQRLLGAEPGPVQDKLQDLLSKADRQADPAQVSVLLPARLLTTFEDTAYAGLARETLGGYLWDYRRQAQDWRGLPPDRLARRAADAQVILHQAQQALNADLDQLFLRPLLRRLRELAGGEQQGLASVSNTTLAVISGTEARVSGKVASYFDLAAPAEPATPPGPAGGPLATATLLTLAQSLQQSPRVWAALEEGVELAFTPHILPGGAAAEVAIDLALFHDSPQLLTEGGSSASPLSRVAEHTANTRIYVNSMDLFALSTLALRTTHPRADTTIPVLGRMPLLGQMFRFPRSPVMVHHENVMVIFSSILPTGLDLGELLDYEVYASP